MKTKEKNLQKQITSYLRLKGCLVVKFNSTGIYNQKTGSYIPMPQKGVSDLLFWCGNCYGAIEVKNPNHTTKPSKDQLAFLEEMRQRGGVGLVAYDLNEVKEII